MERAIVVTNTDIPALKSQGPQLAMDSASVTSPYDRAWLVLLGACLCMFCGTPAVVYFTFGVFLPEIIASTHWSSLAIVAAMGPGEAIIGCTMSPLIGRASDKVGARMVALFGGPAFAIGLAAMGLCPKSANAFVGWTMLMWVLSFSGSTIPYAQVLTAWFDKRRGMAISIMFCCGALGIAAWPPYAAFLIVHLGWRHAYLVMGMSAGAVIFLSGLLLLKKAPNVELVADRPASASGMLVGEAVRTLRFWKLAAIFMLLTAMLVGTSVNLPVILRQRGADAQTAASIMSVVGIAMFLGRVLLGLMLDRWFAARIAIGIAIVPIIGLALMMVSASKIALILAAASIGFGLGSEYTMSAYIVSRAFGFRAFGAIYGLIIVAAQIGSACGLWTISVSLVNGVGDRIILSGTITFLILAILMLSTVRNKDLPFVPG